MFVDLFPDERAELLGRAVSAFSLAYMKTDIFNHFLPWAYLDALQTSAYAVRSACVPGSQPRPGSIIARSSRAHARLDRAFSIGRSPRFRLPRRAAQRA